jgi:hypothetical protein
MLQLEELENRCVPATLVDASTVTYQDVDGDIVTVKASQAIFTAANVNAVFLFDQGSVNGDNTLKQQLQTLSLTSLSPPPVDGLSITVTAVQSGGGDGNVNVGFINGTSMNLGDISVQGDLGRITTGDGVGTAGNLNSLTVQSIGKLGTSTQGGGGSLVSFVPYTWTSLHVAGDVNQAFVKAGAFGSIFVGGSLIGGGADNSGQIVSTGTMGPVTITGSILGGAGKNSGEIQATGYITSLNIGGSVRAGTGGGSGQIFSTGNGIGNSIITGDLVGNGDGYSGRLSAYGDIGNVYVRSMSYAGISSRDAVGNVTVYGAVKGSIINSTQSNMGKVTISGSLIGTAASHSGWINSGGTMGAVKVTGSILGGGGANSGEIQAKGFITSVNVGGSVLAGTGGGSGAIISTGNGIGNSVITGDLVGNGDGYSGRLAAYGDIGNVYVRSMTNAAISSDDAVGNVTVYGDVKGSIINSTQSNMGKVTISGSLIGTSADKSGRINSGGTIGAIQITVSIQGGGGSDSGEINAGGFITSITVGGSVTAGTGVGSGQIDSGGGIGPVSITGDLVAGTDGYSGRIRTQGALGDTTIHTVQGGQINADGGIGKLHIRGDVTANGNGFSGFIQAASGNIAQVTIDGGLIGGPGDSSGIIIAGGTIGAIQIANSLDGSHGGNNSGQIRAGGFITSVSIGGSVLGGAGTESGEIKSTGISGGIGPVTITGNLQAGSGKDSGRIFSSGTLGDTTIHALLAGTNTDTGVISSAGNMGTIHLLTSLQGGTFADSGRIISTGGDITAVNIDGSLLGGTANDTGTLIAAGTINSVAIAGDMTGGNVSGAASLDASGYIHGKAIVGVSIGGSLTAGTNSGLGTLTHDGWIAADNDIGTITVTLDVLGNATNPVLISAAQQAVPTAFADVALHNLILHRNVVDALVLAGYDVNGNGVDADASINSIAVDGNWTASSVEAGTGPGLDGRIGTGDDVNLSGAGVKHNPNLHSIISNITIGGQVAGTVGGTDHFGFVADEIGSLSVGGTSYPLQAGPYNDDFPLGATRDVDAHEIQFIHLAPATLPSGAVNNSYSQTITASGGTAPYSFSISSGNLPLGLSLSSGGVLSGTPLVGGNFFFTIKAADTTNLAGTQNYTLSVSGLVFADNFDRANAPTLGANWQTSDIFVPPQLRFHYRWQLPLAQFQVQNDAAVSVVSSGSLPNAAAQVSGESLQNLTVQADVNAKDPQSIAVGVLARVQGNGDAYVAALTHDGTAEILLFREASATFSVLKSAPAGTNSATLTFTVTGTGPATTLSLYLNGNAIPFLSVTGSMQTTFDTAGGVGLCAWGANGVIDNFSVSNA